MIIARNRASLNLSTTSWHDSWNRLCLSNFLNTELLISAKLLEINSVRSAWKRVSDVREAVTEKTWLTADEGCDSGQRSPKGCLSLE